MKKTIEFDTEAGKHPVLSTKPISSGSGESTYRTLIFRDDMFKRKRKFEPGDHWLRFMPSIKGSKFGWLLTLNIYNLDGVTFVAPNTFEERAIDPIRRASDWLRKNKPEVLRNKETNPDGLKLWATPSAVAWCIDEKQPEGQRLGIYFASKYDGSRGGSTGAAHRLEQLANERDTEPGSPTLGELIYGDITDPKGGRLVKYTASEKDKRGFQSYSVAIGKTAAPLDKIMECLTEEEHNMIAPLETVIYVPTDEEMHDILKGYIGEELYNQIPLDR